MRLKMTLLSDLCSASGENSSGLADIDVNFDELGLPYIPGKRIKGCFRKAALEVLESTNNKNGYALLDKVFGAHGGQDSGELYISNGYLCGYDGIRQGIIAAQDDKDLKYIFNRQNIKNSYTLIRTQTSIDKETKTAKKNTLRFIRLIKKGSLFHFDIKINSEEGKELLGKACRAIKSIGLRRTRGFGEVEFKIEYYDKASTNKEDFSIIEHGGEKCYVKLGLKLNSQLIIPGASGSNNSTESYVPGGNLLGFFAGRYIKKYKLGKDAHLNEEFKRIFLKGDVIFDNAYISNSDYEKYMPCPYSIFEKKDTDDFINLNFTKRTEEMGQLKTLNDKYIRIIGSEYEFLSPKVELEYHHQRPKDRTIGSPTEKDGEFFKYEALSPNQHFLCFIFGNKEDLSEILSLIPEDRIIYLGKSKNAQYSEVKVISLNKENNYNSAEEKHISKGKKFSITLISPMILLNEFGYSEPSATVFVEELSKHIGEIKLIGSYIKNKKISSFNAKWMMPRQQYNAFDAGSTFVFEYEGEGKIDLTAIENTRFGIRANEGFGKINITIDYDEEANIRKYIDSSKARYFDYESESEDFKNLYRALIHMTIKEQLKRKAIESIYYKDVYKEELKGALLYKLLSFIKESNDFSELSSTIYRMDMGKKNEAKLDEKTIKIRQILTFGSYEYGWDEKRFEKEIQICFEKNVLSQIDSFCYEKREKLESYSYEYFKHYYIVLLTQLRYEERKVKERGKSNV